MPTDHQDRRPTPRVRVLIADDHQVFAQMLAAFLASDRRIAIVGYAQDGVEAVELAQLLLPDVVLMDVNMPRLDGIEATQRLSAAHAGLRVVMLSSSHAVEDETRAREAGAAKYLTKDADAATIAQEVIAAVRTPARSLIAPRAA